MGIKEQREKEDQLTEKEKQRRDKLEKEDRLQANNGHVEGEAAEVYEHKDNADEVNAHTQSGTDRQEAQQTDVSSAATVDTVQESNTNAETRKRWVEFEADEKKADEEQRDRSASKASKETIDSLPENVKPIARSLRIAVDQMHLSLTKAKELILESARVLDEEHVEEQDKICKKIKEILKDKIQEGKISEGWIEQCLPREYKRKYTKTESQQNYLSGVQQQPELVVSTKGNQISQSDIDSKAPDTEAISPLFERQEDQFPSAGEAFPAAADVNSMRKTDEIPRSEFKCIIPKEKHEMVVDAMDRSKSAIFVICDENKKFVRVVADVDN